MMFGRNNQSELLLAVIGLRVTDVEHFRDVHVEDNGKTIVVYTRTGGENRSNYPQVALYRNPLFKSTADVEADPTYARFYFRVPDEYVSDVLALSDPLKMGLRPEFGAHLAKTLMREPTENDKIEAVLAAEKDALARTAHFMANGHTFVPLDDYAMEIALNLAELNDGRLRSCWGIMPLRIVVETDRYETRALWSKPAYKHCTRVRVQVDYRWQIDERYWAHCQERFSQQYPMAMKRIGDAVAALADRS